MAPLDPDVIRAIARAALRFRALVLLAMVVSCSPPAWHPLGLRLSPPLPCASAECHNLAVVLDLSGSMYESWELSSIRSSTPFDAQIATAITLVSSLSGTDSAVALVLVSYPSPAKAQDDQTDSYDASSWTELPLTSDFGGVIEALEMIRNRRPWGTRTHLASGIDRATIELLGLRQAKISPATVDRANAHRSMVVFTDGAPTLPHGDDATDKNLIYVARALDRARRGMIETYLFAIGSRAEELSDLEKEVERTGGKLILGQDIDRLVDGVDRVLDRLPH